MTIKEIYVPSCDSIHDLRTKIYIPDTAPVGLFQVVHGMTEHIDRYDPVMTSLCESGYVVFGHDHLGHKGSVSDDSELGFIASHNGWDLLCRDVGAVYENVSAAYPSLPYFLLGHSMGSFVVRLATQKYVTPDRLIVMGTGGPNPLARMGQALIKTIKKAKGERHISSLIYKIALGSYNERFREDGEYGWLTTDAKHREIYASDKYCTFKFTVSAMGDLMMLLSESNGKECTEALAKKQIPILLISGKCDPVGNYGKGVREVYSMLKNAGARVSLKLYPEYRHEILNDTCADEVITLIKRFIGQKA